MRPIHLTSKAYGALADVICRTAAKMASERRPVGRWENGQQKSGKAGGMEPICYQDWRVDPPQSQQEQTTRGGELAQGEASSGGPQEVTRGVKPSATGLPPRVQRTGESLPKAGGDSQGPAAVPPSRRELN